MLARESVQHTTDYDRIAALPRRDATQLDAECWADILTPELRAPGSTATIRPWQAYAYAEMLQAPPGRGVVLWMSVGAGKTWISYMAPRAFRATRPLLIIPAKLRAKTRADFAAYRGVWQPLPAPYPDVTTSWMSREENAHFLDEYRADLIVIDESDQIANHRSGVPRLIEMYWRANPACRVVTMTATPMRWSIMGCWHHLRWSLREGSPLPMHRHEAELWAASLDARTARPGGRPMPGPLGSTQDSARSWLRSRIVSTTGLVVVTGDTCEQPLSIGQRLSAEDSILDSHFQRLLRDQENPGGIQIDTPLSRWLLDGQLGCGLYSRYITPPSEEWRVANRARAKLVREVIARSEHDGSHIVTEAPVLRRYASHPVVVEWLRVRDTFDGMTETLWLSRSTLDSAIEWIVESDEPGIVWCGSVEFGLELARSSGLEYYGAGSGQALLGADRARTMVLSYQAHMLGNNLQPWTRHLLVMPPQSAKYLEQIYGRSHRAGQTSPVAVTVLLTSGGTIDLFETAITEATIVRDTVMMAQKVLSCNIARVSPRITDANRYRWASRKKQQAADADL